MKLPIAVLLALGWLAFAGCASAPPTSDIAVRLGMSRDDLRFFFGEPLRIERAASGGEDWYYRFVAWKTQPTHASGTTDEFGERTSYASVGLDFSRNTEERAIHVSAEGLVVAPLPAGKVAPQ